MKRATNYNKLLKGKTLYRNHRKFLGDMTAQRIPQTDYIFLLGTPHGSNHCHYFVANGTMLKAMSCYEGFAWYTSKGNLFQLLTNNN